eukprot:s3038_g11.t1
MPTCVPSLSCCLIARSLPLAPCCPALSVLLPSLLSAALSSYPDPTLDHFSSLWPIVSAAVNPTLTAYALPLVTLALRPSIIATFSASSAGRTKASGRVNQQKKK